MSGRRWAMRRSGVGTWPNIRSPILKNVLVTRLVRSMRSSFSMRWLVVVLLVLTVATTFATDQDGPWLTGQFLVATEQLTSPPFAGTVIYLILHDAGGAMGLVVNRPVGEAPLARLLDSLWLDPA